MKKLVYLAFVLIICSCSSKSFDTDEALWEYIRDTEHGYIFQKNVNGVDFSLLYKPTDLLVKQEFPSSTPQDQKDEEIQKLRDKYEKYMYFSLSMSKGGQELLSSAVSNRNEFGAMVNQLAFGMGEKVHLFTSKKDTIPIVDFIYPRLYGMTRSTDILLVYPRDKKYLNEKYLNLTIEDLGINTGEIKFKIVTEKIVNQPHLKFK